MWGLAAWVDRAERAKWEREMKGVPFTGYTTVAGQRRRIRLKWGRVVGHICRGEPWGGHSECVRIYSPEWCWEISRP